jgi:hypothetical protein
VTYESTCDENLRNTKFVYNEGVAFYHFLLHCDIFLSANPP